MSKTPQNPPTTINLVQTLPRDNVNLANIHTQYILAEHIAVQRYVPPVYTIGEPTFIAHITVKVPYKIDQYAEMEKETRYKEDESFQINYGS